MKYMMFPTDIEVETRNPETGRYIKVPLHRIRVTKDFSDVKAGDFGGLIQDESNLSQEGDCWIYDEVNIWLNEMGRDYSDKVNTISNLWAQYTLSK